MMRLSSAVRDPTSPDARRVADRRTQPATLGGAMLSVFQET